MAQFLWWGTAAQRGRSDHRKLGTFQFGGRDAFFLWDRLWRLIDLVAVQCSAPGLVLVVRDQKGTFIHKGNRFGLGTASKVIGLYRGPGKIRKLKIPYNEQQAIAQQGDGASIRGDVGGGDRTLVLVATEVEASQKTGRILPFPVR